MPEPPEETTADSAPDSGGRWRRLAVNVALMAGTLLFLLVVLEVTLRLSGFSFVLYPEDIEFGRPDPVMIKVGFQPDDDLFWVTRDYGEKLERLRDKQPPLLLLGDSCTHLGRWDRALAGLAEDRLGQRPRFGNLAVAGWSSHQGREQVKRDVAELDPRVVTLYYGWNDHWIGFGIEDRNVARVRRVFSSRMSGLRLVQLGTKAMVAWGARQTAYPNRVSPADFADNLRTMVADLESKGATPVLITAASNHRVGHEPPELAERWLRNLDDLVPLHRQYVSIVRDVARETGATLCDLEARFADLSQEDRDRDFRADGIHTSAAGDRRMAAFVFECFEDNGLWPLILE
ncbi:MAG: GDSL-type esterase/lipase family protein [Acidobacteriota bacterium]